MTNCFYCMNKMVLWLQKMNSQVDCVQIAKMGGVADLFWGIN